MIEATNESASFQLPPAGTFAARCYSMIHIGTVKENYMGEDKELNKVRITWELPTELYEFKAGEGEKPFSVSQEYTLSMHEKSNLRKMLESWRGKGFTEDEAKRFDITKLLGQPCMLSVIHKTSKSGKSYAAIASVTTVVKGMNVGDQVNKSFEFSYSPFDQGKFDSIPDWIKDKIKQSKEYQSIKEPSHMVIHGDENGNEITEANSGLPF